MTGGWMQDWLTLWISASFALFPITTIIGVAKLFAKMADYELGDLPSGCGVAILILFVPLLFAAPFLGWWCFTTFHVVAR